MLDGGKAFGFLLLLALMARFGTKLVGKLMNTEDDELLVISFLGVAVFVAGVSEWFGVADAIGAFMVGLMLGSTTSGPRILKLVHPLRDAFGAIFFFAFGLSINPGDLPSVLWPVLAAVAVTVLMNVFAGMATAKIYAFGPKATANVSTTLVARGEFALILATMAAGAAWTNGSRRSSPGTCSCWRSCRRWRPAGRTGSPGSSPAGAHGTGRPRKRRYRSEGRPTRVGRPWPRTRDDALRDFSTFG